MHVHVGRGYDSNMLLEPKGILLRGVHKSARSRPSQYTLAAAADGDFAAMRATNWNPLHARIVQLLGVDQDNLVVPTATTHTNTHQRMLVLPELLLATSTMSDCRHTKAYVYVQL